MANSMLSTMGSWDKSSTPTSSRVVSPPVKDDWEDDEDSDSEHEPPSVEKNQQIWEDANTKPHYAMPSVVIARSTSTPSSSVTLPPQAAFQQGPVIKILKRPTSNSPSPAPSNQSANAETLKEREARYQAARDRIFGDSSTPTGESDGSRPASTNAMKPQAKIAREPLGPPGNQSSASSTAQSRGFTNRRGKPPGGGKP